MTDWNPAQVEQGIMQCANRIAKSIGVRKSLFRAFREAKRGFEIACAKKRLEIKARGDKTTIPDMDAEILLATADERAAMDLAEESYRYGEKQAEAIEDELRAWQSVGASVRQAYSVAGRGEA